MNEGNIDGIMRKIDKKWEFCGLVVPFDYNNKIRNIFLMNCKHTSGMFLNWEGVNLCTYGQNLMF